MNCPTCGQEIRRHPVTIGGIEARPYVRNPGEPDEVRFWRAIDHRGRYHDAPTPEAAAKAAGARTE